MVSKSAIAFSALTIICVSAQVDGIISSIVTEISNGIVAGRKTNVPEAQAGSEVGQIITALNANTDIQDILTKAANVVLDGINSDGVIGFVNAARSSLAAFEASPDFKSVDSLIGKYVTDLDPPAAISSVNANLAPILGLVLPPIQSLSSAHKDVGASVEEVKTVGISLLNRVGLLGTQAAASEPTVTSAAEISSTAAFPSVSMTSAAHASSGASVSSAAAASTTTSFAVASSETTSHVTKTATTSSSLATAVSSSVTQVNGGTFVQGGILAAGFVAAGALLL
ncbi:hypothetical protein D0Z03_002809 [Geotrichum reessii]|nr:hypothetical protein D0Z03_002809 [Galactomyces reessii]